MARKSNMVPVSVSDFDPDKQLLRQDIVIFKGVLVVLIKWSKTNQFGSRLLKVPLVTIPGSALCPVKAYKNMAKLMPASSHQPAFLINNGKGRTKVSKVAKIRNRYNQVPHLTQDTNGKLSNSQKTPQTRAKRSALSQQVTTKHI